MRRAHGNFVRGRGEGRRLAQQAVGCFLQRGLLRARARSGHGMGSVIGQHVAQAKRLTGGSQLVEVRIPQQKAYGTAVFLGEQKIFFLEQKAEGGKQFVIFLGAAVRPEG